MTHKPEYYTRSADLTTEELEKRRKRQREYMREYSKKNRERVNENRRKSFKQQYAKARAEVIKVLGGKCECGITDVRVLQIDHVDGGGGEHRKSARASGGSLRIYREMLAEPEKYKLLCANCHAIKTYHDISA